MVLHGLLTAITMRLMRGISGGSERERCFSHRCRYRDVTQCRPETDCSRDQPHEDRNSTVHRSNVRGCLTPLGIAVPTLYTFPVLLASLTVRLEWSMAAAVLANILTYIGYYLLPGGDTEAGYINRLIASVLVWVAVIIGWLLRNVREDIQTFYTRYK